MNVAAIIFIILYVVGVVPTYMLYDKYTNQTTFNKIWFSIFWPASAIVLLITSIVYVAKKLKK